MKRVAVWLDGQVQGVGFRWWGAGVAEKLGLTGSVENCPDGRVEFHLQGPDAAVDEMLGHLSHLSRPRGRPGVVEETVVQREDVVPGERSFRSR